MLTPNAPLTATTNYTVTVTTGVRDASNNPLATQFTSTFTTLTPDTDREAEAQAGGNVEVVEEAPEEKRGCRARQLVFATVVFLAGVVCGGSLATWLGPAVLAPPVAVEQKN